MQVKFPSRETVFDYWLDPETGSFEQWTKSPYFFSIDYDSRVTPMTQVTYRNDLLVPLEIRIRSRGYVSLCPESHYSMYPPVLRCARFDYVFTVRSRKHANTIMLCPACKINLLKKKRATHQIIFERQITVPTPETCSVTFWMQLLVKMRKPVMMAGPSGTGKTQVHHSSKQTHHFCFLDKPLSRVYSLLPAQLILILHDRAERDSNLYYLCSFGLDIPVDQESAITELTASPVHFADGHGHAQDAKC